MEQNQDFIKKWIQSQTDFFITWMESQEKFIKNWAESTSSLQESVKDIVEWNNNPSTDRYYPEYLNWLYSPTAMGDESIKNIQLLKVTFQRQMEIIEEMAKLSDATVCSVDDVAKIEEAQV